MTTSVSGSNDQSQIRKSFCAVCIRIFRPKFCIPSALSRKYFFNPEEAQARDKVEKAKKEKVKDSTTIEQTSNKHMFAGVKLTRSKSEHQMP